jgi:hypothetical protein
VSGLWEHPALLAHASDYLDHVLTQLRRQHTEGQTWTTAEIAEELMAANEVALDKMREELGVDDAMWCLDWLSVLWATAVQRLITGDGAAEAR